MKSLKSLSIFLIKSKLLTNQHICPHQSRGTVCPWEVSIWVPLRGLRSLNPCLEKSTTFFTSTYQTLETPSSLHTFETIPTAPVTKRGWLKLPLKRSPRLLSAFTRGTDPTDPVGRASTQATGSTVTDWRKRDPLKHRPSSALSERKQGETAV